MQDSSKSFEISSTSVLDLKAELFKQKEEFERQKVNAKNQPVSAASRKVAKKPGIWERQNKGVHERSHRDELEKVETSTLEAGRVAMERKAKLYDYLSKTGITDEALSEEVLVDFDRKAWEQPPEDEPTKEKDKSEDPWVEYIDEFGRTRVARKSQVPKIESPVIGPTIPGDDNELISDELLQRWEEAAKRELDTGVGPIHYDETKEIRTKGVGFYRFSKDEEERQEQMRALKQLRLETELKRASRQTIKEKRKAQLDARMDIIRAKRQKKSLKNETNSTKSTEDSITEPVISDVTNISNITSSSTDSINNESSNKVLQLTNPEQAVNDLLSDIRRQIETKKKTG